MSVSVDQLSINTLRILAVEAIQKANTGHPGMPMGCAPIAYTLYTKYMKYNPQNPTWLNRDRFILSAGHGSMLLYGILHLSGYDISLDDLKNFRQWESKTPGHPEFNQKLGIETTTGPLGQGFANAVGMAIAKSYLASMFNKDDIKILDHFIYGICSDGELMEGISHEAASLAGHLKLGKLIFFYDDNGISIDGKTSLAFSENIEQRFDAYGWHVEHISDANDLSQIETALLNAQIDERPSLIITKTHIGFGSPNKQDTSGVHGSPLGSEEIKLTKKNLEWEYEESFFVPEEVKNLFEEKKKIHQQDEEEWNKLFAAYKEKYPAEAKLFLEVMSGNFGDEWISKIPTFADDGKKLATRQASGKTINAIASSLPTFIGGSADLAPSNNTYLSGFPAFSADNKSGRNFHFGIREHAMASLMNGMAMYGGVIPFGGTFLVFSDYLRPAIRLASLSKIKVIYVLTHDSIGLGEDGPTHQPVEHLASLRAIPGLIVLRPADANETASAWKFAIQHKGSPVALILTRQGLPVLDQTKYPSSENLFKGAYILKDADKPEIILMASGSEVPLILKAAEKLESEGKKVRVVSFPSWELFEMQSEEYRNSVLLKNVKARIAIEAGVAQGWNKYTGDGGKIISIETYGASAPDTILFEKYGITVENILQTSKVLLK
ncbi:MAG: transketolase [Ignavibacteriaceae bacterium]|jgi:transketolase|nr:transketolase [Ignavibacteriaceae bacterium]